MVSAETDVSFASGCDGGEGDGEGDRGGGDRGSGAAAIALGAGTANSTDKTGGGSAGSCFAFAVDDAFSLGSDCCCGGTGFVTETEAFGATSEVWIPWGGGGFAGAFFSVAAVDAGLDSGNGVGRETFAAAVVPCACWMGGNTSAFFAGFPGSAGSTAVAGGGGEVVFGLGAGGSDLVAGELRAAAGDGEGGGCAAVAGADGRDGLGGFNSFRTESIVRRHRVARASGAGARGAVCGVDGVRCAFLAPGAGGDGAAAVKPAFDGGDRTAGAAAAGAGVGALGRSAPGRSSASTGSGALSPGRRSV